MTDGLAERRMTLVKQHMDAENARDFDRVVGTFSHPRYELVGQSAVFDGEAAVRQYFEATRTAFPDQRNHLIKMRSADDAVIVEFWLTGTHKGPLPTPAGTMPATGKSFRERMCAIFEFDGDRIVCERIYFDRMSVLEQLTR